MSSYISYDGALLHASESGVRDVDHDLSTAWTYAGELARYVRCPSTIRQYCIDRYGNAPPVEDIRELQEAHQASRERFRQASDAVGARSSDAFDFEPKRIGLWPHEEGYEPQRKPEPDDTPIVLKRALTPREIIADIERAFNLDPGAITGGRRLRPISYARRTAAYVLHRRHNSSPQIARWLGGLNHTSILYAIKQFELHATPEMRRVAARYLGDRA